LFGKGAVTMVRQTRRDRQRLLRQRLSENPLQTDEDLAQYFGVSVPTIRLDRLYLGIPPLRLRSEGLARQAVQGLRTLAREEIAGELIDLDVGRSGRSVMDTTAAMALERTGIVRSQYIFAQADSLAQAVVDGDVALTGLVSAKYKQAVPAGSRVWAVEEVIRHTESRWVVLVVSTVDAVPVFRAKMVVMAVAARGVMV